MKPNTNQRKTRSRIVSAMACLALALCALLPFCFTSTKTTAIAAKNDPSEVGIRFVQVAAGEGFAIGLTYDGKLYGWSTKVGPVNSNEETMTLADYYPKEPRLIDCKFRLGPGDDTTSGIPVTGAYHWDLGSWTINSVSVNYPYHQIRTNVVDSDDRIIQIAATRYTAAFITEKGYIYTWGKETGDQVSYNSSDYPNKLLLRPLTTSGFSSADATAFEPYIIDYNYGSSTTNSQTSQGLLNMRPFSGVANMTIAAGEYSYIVSFSKNSDNKYYTFVWGTGAYSLPNYEPIETVVDYSGSRTDNYNGSYKVTYMTDYTSSDNVIAVAGGFNVGINGGSAPYDGTTTLSLKGRNFVSTKSGVTSGAVSNTYLTTTSHSYNLPDPIGVVSYDSYVSMKEGSGTTVQKAILGNVQSSDVTGASIRQKVSNTPREDESDWDASNIFYARQQASGTNKYKYSVANTSSYIKDAKGNTLSKSAPSAGDNTAAKTVLSAVSLGNDIGYGIVKSDDNSTTTVYSWGDDYYGQSGNLEAVRTTGTENAYANGYPQAITGLNSKKILSIAAGKQLSGSLWPLISKNTLDGEGKFVANGPNGVNAQNDANYITGALCDDGSIYVWCNSAPKPTPITFNDNTNASNSAAKFAAVYSGYGNNLYAVSVTGKLVLIRYESGGYTQKIYDSFKNANGAAIDNWTVASASEVASLDSVEFKVISSTSTNTPELGEFTFFLNNGRTEQTSVELNGIARTSENNGDLLYKGARGSVVRSNSVGDVYRILDPTKDGGKSYVNEATLSAPTITFTYKGHSMNGGANKEQENMFKSEVVYDPTYGVGIKITPHQSSHDEYVTLSFYVARYDSADNFNIVNEGYRPADNAIYYDFKQVSVRFKINNTPKYTVFKDFEGDNNEGNSMLPLLDPNNDYNKYYSVALMNVNDGISALADYLNHDAKDTIVSKIIEKMRYDHEHNTGGDKGFPDSQSISKGNLEYYLGTGVSGASRYYNNEYKYLFADRDADLIKLRAGESVTLNPENGAQRGVTGTGKTIVISDVTVTVSDPNLITQLNRDFNNNYGLYDIVVADNKLSFKYDVVQFEATGSTGSLMYGDDKKVTSYLTNSDGKYLSAFIRNTEYTRLNADCSINTTTSVPAGDDPSLYGMYNGDDTAMAVFSQPTLRLTDDLGKGEGIFGAAAATNKNHISYNMPAIAIGDVKEINLTEYVSNTGGNIHFSFDDKHSAYNDFNSQFVDETGNGIKVVELTSEKITVRPTTKHDIIFTVSVQRFFGDGNQVFAGGDEKVSIQFSFKTINTFELKEGNATTSYSISSPGKINVIGADDALNRSNALISLDRKYYERINITGLQSSSPNILTVAPVPNSRYEFTVTPKSSGTAVVQFVVTVYGESLALRLDFNVSGLTTVSDTLDVIDVHNVYMQSMINELRQANSFNTSINNYDVLYGDKADDDHWNAVYFTDAAGNRIDGYPSYVKSVVFSLPDASDMDKVKAQRTNSEITLRVELNSEATDTAGEYYLHIRYIDRTTNYDTYEAAANSTDASILETSMRVRSSRRIVKTDTGEMLTVFADCDEEKPLVEATKYTTWHTDGGLNANMRIYIPVRYLLTNAGEQTPENYMIFLVTSTTEAAEYFNYTIDATGDNVVIEPLYNTVEPVVVKVSVCPKSTNLPGTNQILTFRMSITGISTTLPKSEYIKIWLVAFFGSFGLLLIIFIIRMIVYWRRRAKQRALIKRNQELIKMRDRIHNKSTAATREQLVKSKMKMQDPKYAKMVGDIKRERQGDTAAVSGMGVTVNNIDDGFGVPPTTEEEGKKGKKKKKGGKKSIAELKAELEAKKAAFAQAQNNEPVNPFGAGAPDQSFGGGPGFGDPGFAGGDPGFAGGDPGFGSPADAFTAQDLDVSSIIFDAPDGGNEG